MKLINGMEPERYLASLLLANSSYKGEKYYEKEDEYTEIIKENKHLLLDNNDNGPIDEGDDGDKKYNIYEYKNLTPKQLREIYRNVTGLNNDEEFTNQEIVKYLLDALQESKKWMATKTVRLMKKTPSSGKFYTVNMNLQKMAELFSTVPQQAYFMSVIWSKSYLKMKKIKSVFTELLK